MTEFFVLLITVCTAVACALIGNFMVLRKLSLMGDAISHAILPGIIVAFFLAGNLTSPLFFVLSVIFALIMAGLIQWISENVKVSSESIVGIVFTALFALGVILLVQFAGNVHLDQDAVLYGQVEFSAWNRLIINGVDIGPRALWTMGFVLLLNLSMILIFYKELKVSTFDPALAKSLGFSPRKMHYLVMTLIAITVVAAFEAVGAVLVVALLIVPAVTAYLCSNRLSLMILLSVIFAILSSVSGYFFAFEIDGSIAGSVAVASGLVLALVVLGRKIFKI